MKKKSLLFFALIFLFSLAIISALTLSEKNQISECKKECKIERYADKKSCLESFNECRDSCSGITCKRDCSQQKRNCLITSNNNYKTCNIMCLNNGTNFSISEQECQESGGFYHELCNGPYFGISCSQDKFCICNGNFNYTCPANYQCTTSFVSPNKRSNTILGWKNLLGVNLGEIGICGKKEI